jgi:hypothetical protein
MWGHQRRVRGRAGRLLNPFFKVNDGDRLRDLVAVVVGISADLALPRVPLPYGWLTARPGDRDDGAHVYRSERKLRLPCVPA